jgi:hypothetical protein
MDDQDAKLRGIWQQQIVPVVCRQTGSKPLLLRLPYASNNREWLKGGRRNKPKWDKDHKRWEAPRAWFEAIIRDALQRFGSIYVIQQFHASQKCAPACWDATGINCECSCMGANHGSGQPSGRWYIVSDTCAVQWGGQEYSCRLITK